MVSQYCYLSYLIATRLPPGEGQVDYCWGLRWGLRVAMRVADRQKPVAHLASPGSPLLDDSPEGGPPAHLCTLNLKTAAAQRHSHCNGR